MHEKQLNYFCVYFKSKIERFETMLDMAFIEIKGVPF